MFSWNKVALYNESRAGDSRFGLHGMIDIVGIIEDMLVRDAVALRMNEDKTRCRVLWRDCLEYYFDGHVREYIEVPPVWDRLYLRECGETTNVFYALGGCWYMYRDGESIPTSMRGCERIAPSRDFYSNIAVIDEETGWIARAIMKTDRSMIFCKKSGWPSYAWPIHYLYSDGRVEKREIPPDRIVIN